MSISKDERGNKRKKNRFQNLAMLSQRPKMLLGVPINSQPHEAKGVCMYARINQPYLDRFVKSWAPLFNQRSKKGQNITSMFLSEDTVSLPAPQAPPELAVADTLAVA